MIIGNCLLVVWAAIKKKFSRIKTYFNIQNTTNIKNTSSVLNKINKENIKFKETNNTFLSNSKFINYLNKLFIVNQLKAKITQSRLSKVNTDIEIISEAEHLASSSKLTNSTQNILTNNVSDTIRVAQPKFTENKDKSVLTNSSAEAIKTTIFKRDSTNAGIFIGNGMKTNKSEQTFEPVVNSGILIKNSVEVEGNYIVIKTVDLSPFTIRTGNNSKNWDGDLQITGDKSIWWTWNGTVITASNGILYMRGKNNRRLGGATNSYRFIFTTSADYTIEGNIENLLDYEKVANGEIPLTYSKCFGNLFNDCTRLIKAPKLPRIEITASRMYYNLFRDCTSLVEAPELPATSATNSCYSMMFYGCTSLKVPPKINLFSIPTQCCKWMFARCTSLEKLPALRATYIGNQGYTYMFQNCSKIKLSTTKTGIYQNEFRIPTSGTGTTFAGSWADYMFQGTGGTFTETPTANTTYYTSNEIIY